MLPSLEDSIDKKCSLLSLLQIRDEAHSWAYTLQRHSIGHIRQHIQQIKGGYAAKALYYPFLGRVSIS